MTDRKTLIVVNAWAILDELGLDHEPLYPTFSSRSGIEFGSVSYSLVSGFEFRLGVQLAYPNLPDSTLADLDKLTEDVWVDIEE